MAAASAKLGGRREGSDEGFIGETRFLSFIG